MYTEIAKKYLRVDKFPHIWCAGCGNGIAFGALLRAIDKTGWSKNEIVLVSGIGCSSRLPGYADFNTLHTTHGRALTFATGVKCANPKLKVIVIMGDGDAVAIGGNHLIHAAKRNIGLTAIVFNNFTYGMTGAQVSPTAPIDSIASTAPYGNIERPFDLCKLVISAGATYVARGDIYRVNLLERYILSALKHKGFAFVEVITGCYTGYGRANKLRSPVDMFNWIKEHTLPISADKNTPSETDKIPVGEFVKLEMPEYTELYKEKILKKFIKDST